MGGTRPAVSGLGGWCARMVLVCGVGAVLCGGCHFSQEWHFSQERYERTEYLEAPLEAQRRFAAETYNGAIAVKGVDEERCRVTARIIGYAPKIEEAQRLAEQVRVRLEARDGGLATLVEKPNIPLQCGVCVEFDVAAPRRTGLDLVTHNGAVRVSDIAGDVRVKTHNGEVRLERVVGRVDLETHNGQVVVEGLTGLAALETYNGRIVCRGLVGPLNAVTHNGDVEVVYSEAAGAGPESRVVTHNGSIDFTGPPGLSARVRIQTHRGTVRTAVPITMEGEIAKNRVIGTAGAGEGMVRLETHNGSITLR